MATSAPPKPKTAPALRHQDPEHNCPFYGRHLALTGVRPPTGLLLPQRGNQCALITDSFHPCDQEIHHEPIDWKVCPVVRAVRPPEDTAPWPFIPAEGVPHQ